MNNADFLTIQQIAKLAKEAGMKTITVAAWKARAKQGKWVRHVIDGKPAYHVSVLSGNMRRLVKRANPDMELLKLQRAQDMQAARKAVLAAIEARMQDAGLSWREAALEFVAAVEAATKLSSAASVRQIKGFDLPYTILREAKEWTAKGKDWSISLRQLYNWRQDDEGPNNRPPNSQKTGSAGSFEKGFRAAAAFIWASPDAVLECLVMLDEARFADILRRRGYRVERVQSEPVQSRS